MRGKHVTEYLCPTCSTSFPSDTARDMGYRCAQCDDVYLIARMETPPPSTVIPESPLNNIPILFDVIAEELQLPGDTRSPEVEMPSPDLAQSRPPRPVTQSRRLRVAPRRVQPDVGDAVSWVAQPP